MEEALFRSLCERMASLETAVRMHIDAEWKLWAFLATIAGAMIINILQNRAIHKDVKNGNKPK